MSYLDTLRCHFAGTFFSDPSTVNNHPGHYDNASFDRAQYWRPGSGGGVEHGWWNPEGANLFKLLNVRLTSAYYGDGSAVPAAGESLLTLQFQSRDGRSAAKMVDLDPDQQLVSMIFGLTVALVDGQNHVLMLGTVEPAPFSDIWSRGRGGPASISGDERAGVFYQSVIQVTSWGDLSGSRFLRELRAASPENLLSVKFNLDGYSMTSADANRRHTGRIVGTLAAARPDEKRHWFPGRQLANDRFDPGSASPGFRPPANFGVAMVDATRRKVRLDLGNALTLDVAAGAPPHSPVSDFGQLALVCMQADGTEAPIAAIPYGGAEWYERTAGVIEVPADRTLTDAEFDLVTQRPLGVVSTRAAQGGHPAQHQRMLTEPPIHVRADMFVARLNPGDEFVVDFLVTRLGQPASGAVIELAHNIPPGADAAANFPVDGLTFPPQVVCDAGGHATATLSARDPGAARFFFEEDGPRRVHVDGQVYRVAYLLNGESPGNPSDYLSILVWNQFQPDEPPTWHGSMRAVFEQFANLYPYMTTRGQGPAAPPWLDLADYAQVTSSTNLPRIAGVFQLADTHPHYMPVTRDLSRSKREAMLRWLQTPGANGLPLLGTPPPAPPPAHALAAPVAALPAETPAQKPENGSKTAAGAKLRLTLRRRQ